MPGPSAWPRAGPVAVGQRGVVPAGAGPRVLPLHEAPAQAVRLGHPLMAPQPQLLFLDRDVKNAFILVKIKLSKFKMIIKFSVFWS